MSAIKAAGPGLDILTVLIWYFPVLAIRGNAVFRLEI